MVLWLPAPVLVQTPMATRLTAACAIWRFWLCSNNYDRQLARLRSQLSRLRQGALTWTAHEQYKLLGACNLTWRNGASWPRLAACSKRRLAACSKRGLAESPRVCALRIGLLCCSSCVLPRTPAGTSRRLSRRMLRMAGGVRAVRRSSRWRRSSAPRTRQAAVWPFIQGCTLHLPAAPRSTQLAREARIRVSLGVCLADPMPTAHGVLRRRCTHTTSRRRRHARHSG